MICSYLLHGCDVILIFKLYIEERDVSLEGQTPFRWGQLSLWEAPSPPCSRKADDTIGILSVPGIIHIGYLEKSFDVICKSENETQHAPLFSPQIL